MTCTYLNCQSEAIIPQLATDGEVWANLCSVHNNQLEESIKSGDPKSILSHWVKAQGGAKKAAQRMLK